MTPQNPLETPQQTPLDAERAKLRAAGYTESEVSQILIARAVAPAQATSGGSSGVVGQQGMLSGALNNFNTALSVAKNALPNVLVDLRNIFAAGVTPAARAKAASSLAIKALLVLVVGYAISQEWKQHIISGTETAANQAAISGAERAAATAKAKGVGDRVPTVAEIPPNDAAPSGKPKRLDWKGTGQK